MLKRVAVLWIDCQTSPVHRLGKNSAPVTSNNYRGLLSFNLAWELFGFGNDQEKRVCSEMYVHFSREDWEARNKLAAGAEGQEKRKTRKFLPS